MNVFARLNPSILFLVLLLSTAVCAGQEDRCRDVLQDGVKDQYSDLKNHDVRSSMQSAVCSAYDTSHNGSSGGEGSLNVPIAGKLLGASGGYDQKQLDTMGSKYCGDNSSKLSDSDYTNTLKRVASEKVLTAWSECMKEKFAGQQGGLESDIEPSGSEIVFKVRWVPRFNAPGNVTVADLYTKGATCTSRTVYEGSEIGTEWKLVHCTRTGNDPVLISVEAADNNGSTSQKLDQLQAPDVPKTIQVEFRTETPRLGAPLPAGCSCVSLSPGTDKDGHKTVNIRNDCPDTVPVLGIKDSKELPPGPEDMLLAPRQGRGFAYIQLESHTTGVFDGTGAVGSLKVQEFACPGTDIRPVPLRCQVGQIQPPGAPPACYLHDGIVGEKCQCQNGAIGITTQ